MRRGQSILEYIVLIIIIVAAFLAMQVYIKRAFMGRWKTAVDDLGDQYDSNYYQGNVHQTLCSISQSAVFIAVRNINGTPTNITFRTDTTTSQEQKQGQTDIAPGGL